MTLRDFAVGAALLISVSSHAVIFGEDDRTEVESSLRATEVARATAMMISPVFYQKNSKGFLDLQYFGTLEQNEGVCSSVRYASQMANPVSCTGFLVAPDTLVTAGHCTSGHGATMNPDIWCKTFDWIFDYQLDASGRLQMTNIDPAQVFHCKSVVKATFDYSQDAATKAFHFGADFVVLKLDRAATSRAPLKMGDGHPSVGEKLLSVGYPNGLPAKATTGSVVAFPGDLNSFKTDLDAFTGESGSPVLNSRGEVEGILVRAFPDADYIDEANAGCGLPTHCDSAGAHCESEDLNYLNSTEVQRIDAIRALIKL